MAHFAKINASNVVVFVTTIDDAEVRGNGGSYTSEVETYVSNKMGGGTWKQTSYTGRHRKNFAGPGMPWDATNDGFQEIKGDWRDSWTLNTDTLKYEPPHACPNETQCLTGTTWKDDNDVTIKQAHVCSWIDSAGRWESKIYAQNGSLVSEHYWDNDNSQWEDK